MNKDEIIKIAKKITRDKFLEEYSRGCPSRYLLGYSNNICSSNTSGCIDCWKSAIKDIKFKDESITSETTSEKPKEYAIHNLMNDSPSETKFLSNDHLFRIQLGELQTYDEDTQVWRKSVNSLKQILDMKFTKVEDPKLKPMTFEEAVRTGKKIKFKCDENSQDEFELVNETIKNIMEDYAFWVIKNIFLIGKWYAEGVYEE